MNVKALEPVVVIVIVPTLLAHTYVPVYLATNSTRNIIAVSVVLMGDNLSFHSIRTMLCCCEH